MGNNMNTIKIYEENKVSDQIAADRNYAEIVSTHPWLKSIYDSAIPILQMNASDKSKMVALRGLADRINNAIRDNIACRGQGCSHCCFQAVTISGIEATWIQEANGQKMKANVNRRLEDLEEMRAEHTGKPCTFLKGGACSIYEVRPIACRLAMNLGDSPFFCDTSIPAELSAVPAFDLTQFWLAYSQLILKTNLGDIRDYFPV